MHMPRFGPQRCKSSSVAGAVYAMIFAFAAIRGDLPYVFRWLVKSGPNVNKSWLCMTQRQKRRFDSNDNVFITNFFSLRCPFLMLTIRP